MNSKLDTISNVLLACACLVVTTVGILDIWGRVAGAKAPPRSPAPVPAAARGAEPVDGVELTLADAPVLGSRKSGFVVVEFSDYQCPFCGRYARETYRLLQREFVESGKVAYAFMDFPLERIHASAFRAAEAARCAAREGKYWDMHDRMFANQSALAEPDLLNHGRALGLGESYRRCLATGLGTTIRNEITEGHRAGVSSTPTFLIGRFLPNNKVRVLRRLRGAQPYFAFQTSLRDLLAGPGHAGRR
jgi:protein-disulfide isomerase